MVNVRTLEGPALDWAVAVCEGVDKLNSSYTPGRGFCIRGGTPYSPSTNWALGGPIIDREGIETKRGLTVPFVWAAFAFRSPRAHSCGPTPLVAVMRCYVISKLGEEIELPELLRPAC